MQEPSTAPNNPTAPSDTSQQDAPFPLPSPHNSTVKSQSKQQIPKPTMHRHLPRLSIPHFPRQDCRSELCPSDVHIVWSTHAVRREPIGEVVLWRRDWRPLPVRLNRVRDLGIEHWGLLWEESSLRSNGLVSHLNQRQEHRAAASRSRIRGAIFRGWFLPIRPPRHE